MTLIRKLYFEGKVKVWNPKPIIKFYLLRVRESLDLNGSWVSYILNFDNHRKSPLTRDVGIIT